MKMFFERIFIVLLYFLISYEVKAQGFEISPVKGYEYLLRIEGSRVFIEREGRPAREIALDAEKKIHIEVNDYNFDGAKDFATWHMDDGMGIYKVYRVFVFNKKNDDFIEIFPDCSDEFLNLKVDSALMALISTYYDEGAPKIYVSSARNNRK